MDHPVPDSSSSSSSTTSPQGTHGYTIDVFRLTFQLSPWRSSPRAERGWGLMVVVLVGTAHGGACGGRRSMSLLTFSALALACGGTPWPSFNNPWSGRISM
jgi:hypothetical protein